MHERSLIGQVDGKLLKMSNLPYARHRSQAVRYLVEKFEHAGLRDEWLVATISLMDRTAATCQLLGWTLSRAPGSVREARPLRRYDSTSGVLDDDVMAQVLAAALCVLKLSSAEAESQHSMKDLVRKMVGRWRLGELWRWIFDAELQMYRLLDFKVAVPSIADINSRMVLNIVMAAGECAAWPGLKVGRVQCRMERASTPHLVALSTFLVELGIVHAPDDVYGEKSQPASLARAVAQLALHSFGVPPYACVKEYQVAQQALMSGDVACHLPTLTMALYKLWKAPPRDSKIMWKWKARQDEALLQLPEAPEVYPLQLEEEVMSPPSTKSRMLLPEAQEVPQVDTQEVLRQVPRVMMQEVVRQEPKIMVHEIVERTAAPALVVASPLAPIIETIASAPIMAAPIVKRLPVKKNSNKRVEPKRFTCEFCPARITPSNMAAHVRTCHGEEKVRKRGRRYRSL